MNFKIAYLSLNVLHMFLEIVENEVLHYIPMHCFPSPVKPVRQEQT